MLALTADAAKWFLPFALPICIWVAWSDMKFMKIPNKAVLALLAVFVVVGFFAVPWPDYAWRFLHLIVILVIGFIMNMIGGIGAGDAKFAAVMAPFVVFADTGVFMLLLAMCIIAAFILHRLARATPAIRNMAPSWESWTNRKFPMGTALGASLVLYLALGLASNA